MQTLKGQATFDIFYCCKVMIFSETHRDFAH